MARSFTAASSHALVASSCPISSTTLSMACWFNPSGTTTLQYLMALGSSSTDIPFAVLRISASATIQGALRNDAATTDTATSAGTYSAGSWQHAATTLTSNQHIAYLGGVAGTTATTSVTGAITMNRTAIGVLRRTGSAGYLSGSVAYPCIWDVALAADDVAQLADGVHPSLVRPESIVSLWDLTGGSSPESDIFGVTELALENAPGTTDNPRIIMPQRKRFYIPAAAAPSFKSAFARGSNIILSPGSY